MCLKFALEKKTQQDVLHPRWNISRIDNSVFSSVFECMVFVVFDTCWDPKAFLQHEESLKTIKENALFRTLPGEPNRKFVGNWCNIPKTIVRKTCHISGWIQWTETPFLYFWYPGRTSRYRLCSLYPILQGLPIRWVWSQKATWAWSCQNVSDVVLCRSSYNSMVPALCLVEKDGNFILKRMIENNWYLYRTPTGWVDTT